ncbi:phage gp6-like head-tail connector protein [Vibrio vulnificus]|nr:phage gp6-like head-tail connector protein [Vibrio vulnificus]
MNYKILNTTIDPESLLPLSELMDYLRIYDYQEEALVSIYRDAAISFAEAYMNRSFGSGTVLATFSKFSKSVQLPLSNHVSVLSVTAYTSNNEQVTLNNFRHNSVSGVLTFLSDYSNHSDFDVLYSVQCSELAPAIKIGMMKLVATWYENREDISNGVSVAEVPMNHKRCFDLFRLTPSMAY